MSDNQKFNNDGYQPKDSKSTPGYQPPKQTSNPSPPPKKP